MSTTPDRQHADEAVIEHTMHIGEVAERTGLSLRTLRHYDEVGIVRPTGRTAGGFRLYTEGEIDRLLLIRRMKPLGFSIEEMKDLLDLAHALRRRETPAEDQLDALKGWIRQARDRRDYLARRLAMADEFIDRLVHEHHDAEARGQAPTST